GYGSKPMASVQERLEAQRAGLYQPRAPPWENGSLQYHHQALVMVLSPWLQYRSVLRPNGPDCGHRPGNTSVSAPGAGYGSKPMASVQERLEAQRAGLYQSSAPP